MVKLSVIGAKDFDDYKMLADELNKESIDVLVTGGKQGADLLAHEYCLDHEIPMQVILPEYDRHGKSANYKRNLQIIEQSNRIIVFWDYYKKSPFNYLPYVKQLNISFRTVIY
ncbi:MAG: SLOG family protein [Bacteroidota bacterium]